MFAIFLARLSGLHESISQARAELQSQAVLSLAP